MPSGSGAVRLGLIRSLPLRGSFSGSCTTMAPCEESGQFWRFKPTWTRAGGVGQSRVFVMAGFLASAKTWGAFEDHWGGAALKKTPRLDYFRDASS